VLFFKSVILSIDLKSANSLHPKEETKNIYFAKGNSTRIFAGGKAKMTYFTRGKYLFTFFVNIND
jgi:hypothetical protein